MLHHRQVHGASGGDHGKGPRAGQVRADGKLHVDAGGAFEPLGTTFFWFYWGWKNDQGRTRKNAEHVSPWADHFRVFGEVGGPSWADRVIDPRDADYVDTWRAILDYLWRTLQVRVMFTVFGGGTGADPDATVSKVIEVIRGREDAILSVEVCNEGNGVDRATARRLCQRLQAAFPGMLVATTSDTTEPALDLDVASAGETHTERQAGDEDWRQVRQGCELMGVPKTKGGSEPPGPQSSVAELWDPLRLGCLRRVHSVSGTTRWVLHLGAGIRGGGAADLARGRKANLWEYDEPGLPSTLTAIVTAVRATDGLAPLECANWAPMKGHWQDTRVIADMVWPDSPDFKHGCVRVYGSYTGDQFVDVCFGIKDYVILVLRFGPWKVKVYDVLTGALLQEVAVPDGGTLKVDGDKGGGSSAAVLLVATR